MNAYAEMFHPAANIFPLMPREELDKLKTDIFENGQQVAVWRLEGKIIDGRNRYVACMELGIEPLEGELDPEQCPDPIKLALSLNLHRRHLSKSQLSMVAARAKELYDAEAKERQKRKPKSVKEQVTGQIALGQSRDKAGEAVGVSGPLVDAAAKVLKQGAEELVAAVETGEIAVQRAAKIAELPIADQWDELNKPKPEPKPKAATKPNAVDPLPAVNGKESNRIGEVKELYLKLCDAFERLNPHEQACIRDWIEATPLPANVFNPKTPTPNELAGSQHAES